VTAGIAEVGSAKHLNSLKCRANVSRVLPDLRGEYSTGSNHTRDTRTVIGFAGFVVTFLRPARHVIGGTCLPSRLPTIEIWGIRSGHLMILRYTNRAEGRPMIPAVIPIPLYPCGDKCLPSFAVVSAWLYLKTVGMSITPAQMMNLAQEL
jgi:hypothetical protein